MFDTHYDLLTILYCCYIKNDYSYVYKIKKELNELDGLIANLYFMNEKEMKEILKIEKINVVDMFRISTELCKKYFSDKKIIYSIEGADYIEIADLDILYNMGLRNILLTWNNKNMYGSGIRSNIGLTKKGEGFIKKCIELGLCIDLSHMNLNTFNDTIKIIEKYKNVKLIASHSNCYNICNNKRNLLDQEIIKIKKLNGIVSLVCYGPFISDNLDNLENKFLAHIIYLEEIVGINNIAIATDDMSFLTYLFNIDINVSLVNHENCIDKLTCILKKVYNNEEIKKILYKNIEKYLEV